MSDAEIQSDEIVSSHLFLKAAT